MATIDDAEKQRQIDAAWDLMHPRITRDPKQIRREIKSAWREHVEPPVPPMNTFKYSSRRNVGSNMGHRSRRHSFRVIDFGQK